MLPVCGGGELVPKAALESNLLMAADVGYRALSLQGVGGTALDLDSALHPIDAYPRSISHSGKRAPTWTCWARTLAPYTYMHIWVGLGGIDGTPYYL